MANKVLQTLDSFRLAQSSVQAPCYICEEENPYEAELCRYCQAPMALTHQAASQKTAPQLIAAIGSAGAGKTVYLGLLTDMLSRQNNTLQLVARGAFSITLQQTTMTALANCEFPEKTPNEPDRWEWVHSQVLAHDLKKPMELIMPDLAGEALLEEIDHPNTYPVIRQFLSKCSAMLILVDANQIGEAEHNQDYFSMKIVSYLCELDNDPKKGWPNRPVSMVFTKADLCEECFVNPTEFAKQHAPGLHQQCYEKLKRHSFFAAGMSGVTAYQKVFGGRRKVPLRVEPRGIIEPFSWLITQLAK